MPALSMATPEDFSLPRDCCSYGYFLLAPNHWHVQTQTLTRPFRLPGGAVFARLAQPRGPGTPLRITLSRTLDATDRAALRAQVVRMLRLDESAEHVAAFHALDPRWKPSGRARLFRSPTLFEDVIKTVTSCNVTWPSTIQMNRRLCEVLGSPAPLAGARPLPRTFPDARKVAAARPATLRARCRVGYRDARIVQLAGLFRTPAAKGGIDVARIESAATPDEEVFETLLELPGIGPYAAANIMQLLGRYSRLPLDTESVRHGRTLLGFKGSSAQIMKRVHAHYAPFGAHAFRSYWFEMWAWYESKHGPANTWERDSTGRMFTAALLNK